MGKKHPEGFQQKALDKITDKVLAFKLKGAKRQGKPKSINHTQSDTPVK